MEVVEAPLRLRHGPGPGSGPMEVEVEVEAALEAAVEAQVEVVEVVYRITCTPTHVTTRALYPSAQSYFLANLSLQTEISNAPYRNGKILNKRFEILIASFTAKRAKQTDKRSKQTGKRAKQTGKQAGRANALHRFTVHTSLARTRARRVVVSHQ